MPVATRAPASHLPPPAPRQLQDPTQLQSAARKCGAPRPPRRLVHNYVCAVYQQVRNVRGAKDIQAGLLVLLCTRYVVGRLRRRFSHRKQQSSCWMCAAASALAADAYKYCVCFGGYAAAVTSSTATQLLLLPLHLFVASTSSSRPYETRKRQVRLDHRQLRSPIHSHQYLTHTHSCGFLFAMGLPH
jgi:hypothetical protein